MVAALIKNECSYCFPKSSFMQNFIMCEAYSQSLSSLSLLETPSNVAGSIVYKPVVPALKFMSMIDQKQV